VAADETASSLTVTATSTIDTSKSGTAAVTVYANQSDVPTIISVTVSPAAANVGKGKTRTFTATVAGTNNPPQTVTWSVSGGGAGTSITPAGGILTVAADETASSLTVRATSAYDTTKSGTAAVTVSDTGTVPTVTGVTVSPSSATVIRGQTRTFTAAVAGTGDPAQTVTWSVSGGGEGTSITPDGGVLTVAADETASSLTVTATSTIDISKSGTAAITIFGITGFSIGDHSGTIRGTNITVNYPYDNSSQITSLAPLITVTNATLSPASETAQDFTGPVSYTVTAAGDVQAVYTVTVKNSSAKITGFSFVDPPVTGTINESAKTIDIAVPYDTDITAMTPTITVSPRAAVPASGTAQNFTVPVSYTVTAEGGDTATYTVTLIRPGQGGVTLIYPKDEAPDFPDNIILFKSGAEDKPTEQTLTVEEYDSCRWRVDGTIKQNGKSIVLEAADYITGTHHISVEVTRQGVVYSKSGFFKVEN
jgi:hypothetical protein